MQLIFKQFAPAGRASFVDIQEDTLCIDVDKVEGLITDKTKCIICMDYDIFLCDHDALSTISKNTTYQFSMMLHTLLARVIRADHG